MTEKTAGRHPRDCQVVVIGAGIGGLTAGALLAARGFDVLVLEQAFVPGGCASTFKRRGFTFDVGATQVAGLEPGGVHERIFRELGVEPPAARPCDPACAVYLPQETEPICLWRDPERWRAERIRHFPGSERFWAKLDQLFELSWDFNAREPLLPPVRPEEYLALAAKLRPRTLLTLPYALRTVADLLSDYKLADDRRLRRFLDMQLKLYSTVEANQTAALYGAVSLGMTCAPRGLFHLEGSMQTLSDRLVEALRRHNGRLLTGQKVTAIHTRHGLAAGVTVHDRRSGRDWEVRAAQIVANVPVWSLPELTGAALTKNYRERVDKLPEAPGAFVAYLGVRSEAVPADCPPHLQFLYDYDGPVAENNSLFVSVSQPGDGRAPQGCSTIIASSFTDAKAWGAAADYTAMKERYTRTAIELLGRYFPDLEAHLVHVEAATPCTFEHFTARPHGFVGGIGQRPSQFGPFSLSNRTPVENLWLVGDSTHPGEGTAGVSYSALNCVKLLEAAVS
ncbi:C-3',4' desaturase CrtD [Gloeobacter morelensis]|uniref:C-3',4' desaturase CrtD n=1 Tax=Gloeobacter morelensis MG652769 TaxID=2781736 RepID=A0ABY3PI03_9CYAN|nr:C-3',4' desaturase CrtD [Gloeobacter morelensis]UFP93204.1 C-3',4' desaturase CrtD [Gloeobacter morelensis MG652769]